MTPLDDVTFGRPQRFVIANLTLRATLTLPTVPSRIKYITQSASDHNLTKTARI